MSGCLSALAVVAMLAGVIGIVNWVLMRARRDL